MKREYWIYKRSLQGKHLRKKELEEAGRAVRLWQQT
jgi:hypothetical protein